MTRWTPAQVAGLASDPTALAADRRLARPGPWSNTGSTDALVWGKCQGSGQTPYQVSVDLTGPAFRCSCPSRKFPCKHGLALLLLWVDGSGSVAQVGKAEQFTLGWLERDEPNPWVNGQPLLIMEPWPWWIRVGVERPIRRAGHSGG